MLDEQKTTNCKVGGFKNENININALRIVMPYGLS